jgi:competence protein ComEC
VKFTILFAMGIIIQNGLNLSFPLMFVLLLTFALFTGLTVVFDRKIHFTSIKSIFTVISILLLGGIYLCNANLNYKFLPDSFQQEKEITIYGKVTNVELIRKYEVRFEVAVDSLNILEKQNQIAVKLLCRVRDTADKLNLFYTDIYPGYGIKMTGSFQKPGDGRNPGEYNMYASFRNMGLSGYFNAYSIDKINITTREKDKFASAVFNLRKYINKSINELYSDASAGLIKGFIIADRSDIDKNINEAFINSGVVHVLSVSGLHIAYIVLILLIVLSGLGIKLKSVLTIIMLIFFAVITGSPAPVLRSIVMAITVIIAFVFNRNSNLVNSLSIAAFLILLINPNQLFDAGFQLSFTAALSLAAFHPYIKEKILALGIKYNWINSILIFVSITFAAQLGTLPFILSYFHKLSISSFFANIVVVPLTGLIISNAVISLIINIIWFKAATLFAASNECLIYLLYKFLLFAGNPKYSFILIREFSSLHAVLFYIFLITAFIVIRSTFQTKAKIICVLLCCINYIMLGRAINRDLLPDNKLDIVMIDVGQGDAFLVKFPSGKTALIDAGNASQFWDSGERTIFPLLEYLDISKIDYAFISHIDNDHYAGMVYLIPKNIIKKIYKPLPDSGDTKDMKLEAFIRKMNIPVNYYKKEIIDIDDSRIYCYNLNKTIRKDNNNSSGVFKILYGKTSVLFTGDLGKYGEYHLAEYWQNLLHADVLKVSHHGSKYSSNDYFLNHVQPKICLISAGARNKYGHPAPEALERIKKYSQVLRSDVEGAIFLSLDGENINRINWR